MGNDYGFDLSDPQWFTRRLESKDVRTVYSEGRAVRDRVIAQIEALPAKQLPELAKAIRATFTGPRQFMDQFGALFQECMAYARHGEYGTYPTLTRCGYVTPDGREKMFRWMYDVGVGVRQFFSVKHALYQIQYIGWSGGVSVTAAESKSLYFGSPEFTALVLAGSVSPAAVGCTPADLPSPNGLAYLSSDSGEPFVLLWRTWNGNKLEVQLLTADQLRLFLGQDGRSGGWLLAGTTHLPIPTCAALLSDIRSDSPPDPISMVYGYGANLSASTMVGAESGPGDWVALLSRYYPDRTDADVMNVMLSFVHMLRQERIVERENLPVRGGSGGGKSGQASSVVYLRYAPRYRRAANGMSDGDAAPKRTYSHRWVVRGHWRRQWYPSQSRHIPIWISETIAGPEDAPLKVKDKIRMLGR